MKKESELELPEIGLWTQQEMPKYGQWRLDNYPPEKLETAKKLRIEQKGSNLIKTIHECLEPFHDDPPVKNKKTSPDNVWEERLYKLLEHKVYGGRT